MARRKVLARCMGGFFTVAVLMSMQTGCGFERVRGALPDMVEGLTLAQLEQIQDDERLTLAEKREAIREAAGIPNTDAGDRLVNYLLNFVVP